MRFYTMLATLTLAATPVMAQSVPASNAEDVFVQRLTALMDLPKLAADLRDAGVPDSTVRSVLTSMDAANLKETEQVAALTTERDEARAHGPANNFGAFVQRRLAAGDRGQVLAKSIRGAHLARGQGLRRQTEFPNGPEHKEAPKPSTKSDPN